MADIKKLKQDVDLLSDMLELLQQDLELLKGEVEKEDLFSALHSEQLMKTKIEILSQQLDLLGLPEDDVLEEIKKVYSEKGKVSAIQMYRKAFASGLKDAVDAVESMVI